MVSELLTNALRHALPGPGGTRPRRPVRLGLLQHGPWVLCAVADPGKATPVPRPPSSLAETGRGLQMICAFSDQWGYTTPSDAGKVVWAMFTARHAAPSPAQYQSRPGRDRVPGTMPGADCGGAVERPRPPQRDRVVTAQRPTHCQYRNCHAGTIASTTTGIASASEINSRRSRHGQLPASW